jgi:signal transduction histidine kinase
MFVILIIVIISIIAALMLNRVFNFYTENFNNIMRHTLNDELLGELSKLMTDDKYYVNINNVLKAEHGNLGIKDSRKLYVLDMNGRYLLETDDESGASLIKTPNMLAAMNKKTGARQAFGSDYMDYAVYLSGPAGLESNKTECIIYIKDTQEEMRNFSWQIFAIIIQVLLIGLVVAVFLSFFFAKAITSPIQNITKGALKLADGSFSKKIEVASNDELGALTETFNDMAEKIEYMLDQSEELEKSRREFIANVSHELKTPLTSIIGAAETIVESRINEDAKIRFLNMILSEGERMDRIVRDLLVVSRLDNKKMMWEFTFVNPADMVKRIYETMRGEAVKNGQRLILKAGKDIPQVYADKARIEQVLVNIVSNALKYTQSGGKIEFSLGSHESGVKFTVKDNGFGIPEEDLPHIFERFYRVEKARSTEAGGTGLGLSIAKEIVTAHKGQITVDSSPDTGTRVIIILPQNADMTEI